MTSHEALKELFWFKCEKFDAIALGAMGAKQAKYDTLCWVPNKNMKKKTKTTTKNNNNNNNKYRLVALCQTKTYKKTRATISKTSKNNNNKQTMTPGAGCQTKT